MSLPAIDTRIVYAVIITVLNNNKLLLFRDLNVSVWHLLRNFYFFFKTNFLFNNVLKYFVRI